MVFTIKIQTWILLFCK